MSWFDNLMPSRIKTKNKNQQVPDGLWQQCDGCNEVLYTEDLAYNQGVCPKCGHHTRIKARKRLELLFDKDAPRTEIGAALEPVDFLKFKDSKRYKDRITQAQKGSGENEALLAMAGMLHGRALTVAAFEFSYMGGSMGSVVGERFARAVDHAIAHRTPFVCFAASGGARMQEGLTSLMQMAKTSAALTRLSDAGLPYISVLTDPTMGGVSASFAMLGDIIIAEPNALIGFAGPRVIEQTVRETLPEGFQRSEFLLDKGAIDMIVDRRKLRDELAGLLALLMQQSNPLLVSQDEVDVPASEVEEAESSEAAGAAAPNNGSAADAPDAAADVAEDSDTEGEQHALSDDDAAASADAVSDTPKAE